MILAERFRRLHRRDVHFGVPLSDSRDSASEQKHAVAALSRSRTG